MNDFSQNSQGTSVPNTKFDKLFQLVANSNLPIITSVVSANLNHALDVWEATRDGKSDNETLDAVLSLTIQHLLTIDELLDSAISIYSFVDFQLCKKISEDLRLAVLSTKVCTLAFPGKSDFIHGLFLSSNRLLECIDALPDVVEQNKERING